MSRQSVLLASLTSEPASTSELYDRVGYAALTRAGLIPYHAFRAALGRLTAEGLAESSTGRDGSTMWRLAVPAGATAPGASGRTGEPREPGEPGEGHPPSE